MVRKLIQQQNRDLDGGDQDKKQTGLPEECGEIVEKHHQKVT